ncbi:NUDIX domain protein [Calidithermus terrae]|uniref:NUDIX domain protein n=1 Tax=Calidithermus terrae TaxID=1408545 RepID=A0A399EIW2_9DEIN|nr:NUDIX domain-containing protein [Calidithermus terrae]RIH83220.1 NUDIX domain protein [Calidithermus terrae]
MRTRRRAFVYITRETPHGRQLLVFTQDDPAAGVQTPGGTIEAHEPALEGALREACEETGLSRFGEAREVAFQVFDGPDEAVECHYVHLPLAGTAGESWTHVVSSGTDDKGMTFRCFWVSLEEARARAWPHMVYGLEALGG